MSIIEIALLAFGLLAIVEIMWMMARAGLLARGQDYTNADVDAERAEDDKRVRDIVEATGPAPLDRPHIKAGTAWGRE